MPPPARVIEALIWQSAPPFCGILTLVRNGTVPVVRPLVFVAPPFPVQPRVHETVACWPCSGLASVQMLIFNGISTSWLMPQEEVPPERPWQVAAGVAEAVAEVPARAEPASVAITAIAATSSTTATAARRFFGSILDLRSFSRHCCKCGPTVPKGRDRIWRNGRTSRQRMCEARGTRVAAAVWHRRPVPAACRPRSRSEEHTSELQSRPHLVCRLL